MDSAAFLTCEIRNNGQKTADEVALSLPHSYFITKVFLNGNEQMFQYGNTTRANIGDLHIQPERAKVEI